MGFLLYKVVDHHADSSHDLSRLHLIRSSTTMALKIQSGAQRAPLVLSAIFIIIIAVSVSLRVYAKFVKKVKLGLDDYCIFAATVRFDSSIPRFFD